jgi:V/A-type H+-transporting ATPase subunit I
MLRAEPLYRIRLVMLTSELQDAALTLARFGVFNPAPGHLEAFDEAPAVAYRDAWLEAETRLTKLQEQCGVAGPLEVPEAAEAPTLADLEELNSWLKTVWVACMDCHERELQIEDARKHFEALEETLAKLERLNVDLARLLSADSLLAVNLGSLPAAGFTRVTEALAMTGYLVSRFDQVGEQVFAVIAGPRSRHDEVRGLLAQAGWHELAVPDELRTHPQAARAWLGTERERLDAQSGAACGIMDGLRDRFGPRLHEARLRLALARPLAEAALGGVNGKGGLAALSGWVPKRQLEDLRARLDARFHGCYSIELREPSPGEVAEVPSLVRYPGWLAPFVPLVKSYGVPRYGEFDPALPFAFTWLLLFGAMFGDVGHGAVILLLAAALSRRLGHVAWVGVAAGGVSMLFVCCTAASSARGHPRARLSPLHGRTACWPSRWRSASVSSPSPCWPTRTTRGWPAAPPKPCSIPADWPGWCSISAQSAHWRALPARWMSPARPRCSRRWASHWWLHTSGTRPGTDSASASW